MATYFSQLELSGRAETRTRICLAASNLLCGLRQSLSPFEFQPPQEEAGVGDAKVSLLLTSVSPGGSCRPRLPTALRSPAG